MQQIIGLSRCAKVLKQAAHIYIKMLAMQPEDL